MSFIVEAALDVFFEALLRKIASSDFQLVCGKQVCKEIEKWGNTLNMINKVLVDAEEKQMKDQALKIWLADLKDLAYDVDDILDECATKALKSKLMKKHHDQASTSKISNLLTLGSTFDPSTIMFNNKLMSKMRKITERLKSLDAQKSEFKLTDQSSVEGVIPKLPERSSLVDETTVYGRQKDKEEILRLLLSNDDSVSVIPIVGMGGIGKTTLAQLVYNDKSIKDHFHPKAWVSVSNDFEVASITMKILSSVSSCPSGKNNLDLLQVELEKSLKGNKFLLVLDDVWNEKFDPWDQLKRPFAAGASGSKVIVTTRSTIVSSLMRTVPDHHSLHKLSDDDSLRILAHHALGASDFSAHPGLEVIGREIMNKCDGLPLAAKTIGGLLLNKSNRQEWNHILRSQFWESSAEDKSQIMPALWVSYYHLPSRLKQCFACCSLIPKDYEFEEEEIIPVWMAEGCLHQPNNKLSSEDLGRQCFEELASRSFFQASNKEKSKFIMHDLINDLAQSVAQGFYFRMEEQQQQHGKIPTRTRHLSYTRRCFDGFQKFQNVYEAKHLRTFHPFQIQTREYSSYLSRNVVIDVIFKLRYLRVLSLKRYHIYEIPDCIGNLIHLRCLNFSYTKIKCLPDSVCNLYNLEILKLRGCEKITQLPLNIPNLVNLCHLDISEARSIRKMPNGIGRLTNLQVLPNFIVGQGEAANIREMQDLSGLKGKVFISELQNVKEARDAREVRMSCKVGISDLKLGWSEDFDENLRNKEVEREVLSYLEPHKELKNLNISYYAGESFPNWIAIPSFEYLQSLTLKGCRNCKAFPAVGKLPLLKDLCVERMDSVTSIGNEFYGENLTNAFPSLESLRFENMPEWKEWKSCTVDEQGKNFHRLRELHIRGCPKLVESFSVNGFCSLEELEVLHCQELQVSISTLPKLRSLKIDGCKEVVFGSYGDFCSVKDVVLSTISKLACESKEMVMSESIKVESLCVNGCWWETKWGWLAPLESLADLRIEGCPEVVSVGATKIKEEEKEGLLPLDIPCNIRRMMIQNCEGSENICDSFQNLRCLGKLDITDCGKLVSLQTNSLPPTLKQLIIRDCENVQCLLEDREDMNFSTTSLLKSLVVGKCKALKSLSFSGKLPLSLKSLQISSCSELECVAQEISDEACLESIWITDCEKIKKLPQGLDKLRNIHRIHIFNCQEVECLPESGSGSGLLSYSNLIKLELIRCEKLQALPQLKPLDRLEVLKICRCPRLKSVFSQGSSGLPTTNLNFLDLDGPDAIKAVTDGGLRSLTSLEVLCITGDCSNSFPQEKDEIEMKLPASLAGLEIRDLKNVRKISSNTFQNLTSLQHLVIFDCPKLKSLPRKEMLPSLLGLRIWGCPELKKRCKRDKGKLWSNIAHVPWVEIDDENIYDYE